MPSDSSGSGNASLQASNAQKVVARAKRFVDEGQPYVYGGKNQKLCKSNKGTVEWLKSAYSSDSNFNHVLGSDTCENGKNYNWTMQQENTGLVMIDCSGLSKQAYMDGMGLDIGDGTGGQKSKGDASGTRVDPANAQPGDLLLRSGHAAIMGNDDQVIEAKGWYYGCVMGRSSKTSFSDAYRRTGGSVSGGSTGGSTGGGSSSGTLSSSQVTSAISYNRRNNQSICTDIQRLVGVTADGSFGPITVNAIAAWQASKGLEVDGCFGPASKAAANFGAQTVTAPTQTQTPATPAATTATPAPTATVSVTLTSAQKESAINYNRANNLSICRQIQELVGCTVDGAFGPITVTAIANWQASHGLEVDGKFGPASKKAAGWTGGAVTQPAQPATVSEPVESPTTVTPPPAQTPEPAATGDWQSDLIAAGLSQSDIYTGTDTVSPGSHGNKKAVKTLQALVNRAMKGKVSADARASEYKITQTLGLDGDWGLNTLTHLMYFQYSRGLWGSTVDKNSVGVCGKNTWAALRNNQSASIDLDDTVGYESGKNLGNLTLETISGHGLKGLIKTGGKAQFEAMSNAAGGLSISSSYRGMTTQATMSRGLDNSGQIELYALYRVGKGNEAATPGYSPHQHGGALDLSLGSGQFNWLCNHAASYKFENYIRESWHWNYRG